MKTAWEEVPSTLSCTLAIDAMGGDLGPSEVVAGLNLAREHLPAGVAFRLVGAEDELQPLLAKASLTGDERISVHHASEVIGMDEKPVQSIRTKRDSSLVRAVELVKEGAADAAISCGNTGALMGCGTLRLRPIEELERPALAAIIPNRTRRPFILIDAGANPAPKPEHLVHNAMMGTLYARIVLGYERPRVGLMSIGTEEGKGVELTNEAHRLLRQTGDHLNYLGPMEGFQVFGDYADVVVCDGFVGNILLKTMKGLFTMLSDFARDELKANPMRMAGAVLAQGAFAEIKRTLRHDHLSGAPLLGLRGHVIKAHGSSNRDAIAGAMRIAAMVIAQRINEQIQQEATALNAILREATPS